MYEGPVQDLVDALSRLPGIGPKGAQRIALHITLKEEGRQDALDLASTLATVAREIHFCEICGNLAAAAQCRICTSPKRNRAFVCVVGDPKGVVAIERMREYDGLYHVLGGLISPIEGIGPDQLNIASLLRRLADGTVTEVILATDPNIEGEATASFLARLLASQQVKVSRIATGLPIGGDLDYADELTLGRAFEGRTVLSGS